MRKSTNYRSHNLVACLVCFTVLGEIGTPWAVADPPKAVLGESRWTDLGSGVLRDSRSGLQWTRDDNGSDIDWEGAQSYCDGKRSGWRLPSLEELAAIYDQTDAGTRCADALCKNSSQFHLTGSWFWSATQVGKDSTDGIELAWGLLMVNGARTQSVREVSYGSRALCVRGHGI